VSDPPRYAVIVSRFPKFTETFILQELRGMEERGLPLELFAITHETPEQLQPDAADLDRRANYIELRSAAVAKANLSWLARAPITYLRAWAEALWLSRKSTETLVRAPAVVLLAAAMAKRMQELGVQRVHAHWATYPALAALVIKRLTDLPYSFTAHAHDIFVDFGGLATKVREADLVLTCTDHGRGILTRAGGPTSEDKVVLVHHGVDLGRFELQPPATREHRELRVLCVAALQEYKGHRHLFEACRRLVDEGIDPAGAVVGAGEKGIALIAALIAVGNVFLGVSPVRAAWWVAAMVCISAGRADSEPDSSIVENPMIADSGLRTSWLTWARSWLLKREARTARLRAVHQIDQQISDAGVRSPDHEIATCPYPASRSR